MSKPTRKLVNVTEPKSADVAIALDVLCYALEGFESSTVVGAYERQRVLRGLENLAKVSARCHESKGGGRLCMVCIGWRERPVGNADKACTCVAANS